MVIRLIRPLALVLVELVLVGIVWAGLALAGAAPAEATGPRVAAAEPVSTTSAAHPYGDPLWLPLRRPAQIGCAKSACDTGSGHGYWSVDFIGDRGDPVYAAGAGIAHVGGVAGSCASRGAPVSDGRWVWIDHGAGVVTRYHHLDAITVQNGQLVTPATRIGSMGHSGDVAPCSTDYLHFEVRQGGLKGTRVDPGQLAFCGGSGRAALPAALGYDSWDASGLHRSPRLLTPAADTSCMQPIWLRTAAAPTVTVTSGDQQAALAWGIPPAGADGVTVLVETWHPSIRQWGHPSYRTLSGQATGTVVDGLENGRTYRVQVSAHNASGHSAWSTVRSVRPAGLPGAPGSPRYLTWPKRDYVHFGWYRPAANGGTISSFTAARRCRAVDGSFGPWASYRQAVRDAYINFRKLSAYDVCEVRVRATGSAGAGPWSSPRTVRR